MTDEADENCAAVGADDLERDDDDKCTMIDDGGASKKSPLCGRNKSAHINVNNDQSIAMVVTKAQKRTAAATSPDPKKHRPSGVPPMDNNNDNKKEKKQQPTATKSMVAPEMNDALKEFANGGFNEFFSGGFKMEEEAAPEFCNWAFGVRVLINNRGDGDTVGESDDEQEPEEP